MNLVTHLLRLRGIGALFCLAVVWVVFGLAVDRFFNVGNMASIASQMTVLVLLSVGQMFALVVRGFDISVGSVAALASTVAALAVNQFGPIGLVAGLAVGTLVGLFNGVLIAMLRVQPIVTTLGTLIGARGIALLITDNGQVVPLAQPETVVWSAFGSWFGLAPVVWFTALFVALAWGLVKLTVPGRRIVMLGSNPDAASLVGLNATRIHVAAYALTGAFAGLAGLVILARAGAGLPTDGAGMELQSIASAVIGGTPLTGGVASVIGTVFGAAFIQSLASGLNISGLSPFAAEIAIGAVIIAASSAMSAPKLRRVLARMIPSKGRNI